MAKIDPYYVEGPALISFSGGRSSAYALRRAQLAHGGALPSNVHVVFANTGKEREETLDFVREVDARWSVGIKWAEYVPALGGNRVGYRFVTHATASRNGEPFVAMMNAERYVPNQRTRICTKMLKVLVIEALMRDRGLEPGEYVEVIGFRADEPQRVARARASGENADRVMRFPMYDAGVTQADVLAFWDAQPFNLRLEPHESNCDLCFLKGNAIRLSILRKKPERADWWIAQEELRGHRFTKAGRKTYAELKAKALASIQPSLPFVAEPATEDDISLPCGCHD